jgi:hypothetical protein
LRILFVSFGSSIHTARWINQLSDQKWDLHLFPIDPHLLHSDLRDVTVHTLFKYSGDQIDASVRQVSFPWPLRKGRGRVRNILRRLPGDPSSTATRLATTIRRIKPDIVHTMTVHGGIAALQARGRLPNAFPPWIYSSWGADFAYYATLAEFSEQFKAALGACDYLIADCERDLRRAADFGFRGIPLGVFPGAGGFQIDYMQQFRAAGSAASRRLIMLKGRQGDFGARALVALQALHRCADALRDYEIVVYMPQGESVVHAVEYVRMASGLNIRVLPEHRPTEEILGCFGRARVAISVGLVDGTPQSMIEAMIMGALPIQSNTADTNGWIEDGRNGLLVEPEDVSGIAAAITRAVKDDQFVNQAATMNEQITRRIDIDAVRPKVVEMYQRVVASQRGQ